MAVNEQFLVEQKEALEKALTTNPDTEKALRKVIRDVILDARAQTISAAPGRFSDPRNALQSIRTTVYKRVLGANINIFNSRKAHGSTSYVPMRKLRSGQQGGNRRAADEKTTRRQNLDAHDRGFILRFMNDGVDAGRHINDFQVDERRSRWPSVGKWSQNPNTGNRSGIDARNFFQSSAEPALVQAVDTLANLIDEELDNLINKK